MSIKTIEDLSVHELSDTCSAEKQITEALPRLARAATAPELAAAFEAHLAETGRQVERLDQVAGILRHQDQAHRVRGDGRPGRGRQGGHRQHRGRALRDAALIGGA